MEEEDNIIVKWAQEDVETPYSMLNNNNILLNHHFTNTTCNSKYFSPEMYQKYFLKMTI